MKTMIQKTTLFATLAVAGSLFFSSCTKESAGVGADVMFSLSGNASGSQVRPSGSSNSNGTGTFTGNYNSTTNVMTYTSTWSNLTGGPISAGFFSGASGQVGTSVSAWTLGSGLGTSGSVSGTTTLTAQQESQLLSNNWYYVLSTASNTSGEIRGQITATAQ